MEKRYRVIDNFLPQHQFKAIQEYFLSQNMPWYFNDHVVYGDAKEKADKNAYQFIHVMYFRDAPCGVGTQAVQPLIDALEVLALIRIKANFSPVREAHYVSDDHYDDADFTDNKIPYTVGVFYLTTNNGATVIDGDRVGSVENRMVLMAGDLPHHGISATDNRRVLLNFNFINKETQSLYDSRGTTN